MLSVQTSVNTSAVIPHDQLDSVYLSGSYYYVRPKTRTLNQAIIFSTLVTAKETNTKWFGQYEYVIGCVDEYIV